jgi:hypothetical protein
MGSRLELHNILINILGTKDQEMSNVYFQPPATIQLKYPCIIYKRLDQKNFFSNDNVYFGMKKYLITVIDKNPDSQIPDKVMELPYCSFSTHFVSDGLNHDVYKIYF